ncbi:MAG: hypothetical protein RLZZ226_891 [Pseudomonadota bacterium]|jgi:PhoH-like ATPase
MPDKKLFVLDTNVLLHDPSALFRFHEHDIYIPMVVLEELDHHKKGLSDVARNARQASRFMDELIRQADLAAIRDGIALDHLPQVARLEGIGSGRLRFQVERTDLSLPDSLPGDSRDSPDNAILGITLALSRIHTDTLVILVSKDINMRIKAAVLGIRAEDFHNDQVLDDIDLLYPGIKALPEDFWSTHSDGMQSWLEGQGRSFYRVSGPQVGEWVINQCLYMDDDSGFEVIVRQKQAQTAVLESVRDYRLPQHAIWGIHARNREQNFALNLLLDPTMDFVTLLGTAGTGKTLLALAAGLHQTVEQKRYREIIMTRETIPLGEDIGFLPGTEEEKMTPWMGALLDNLELLTAADSGSGWEKATTQTLLMSKIKVSSLNFMRGRTFLARYLILDEAQNLSSRQMKALITRAGPGTKIVCVGNVAQIDTPYLTPTGSGLTYAVDRFRDWPHAAHITLKRGERSRLADFASEAL